MPRALVSGDFFEPNFFATTMMQHGLSAGGPDVPEPSSILAQHRYQVSLAVHYRHHQRKRNPPVGPTAHSLQRNEVVPCDTAGKDDRRGAVEDSCK